LLGTAFEKPPKQPANFLSTFENRRRASAEFQALSEKKARLHFAERAVCDRKKVAELRIRAPPVSLGNV
jgi:hypothetical protein